MKKNGRRAVIVALVGAGILVLLALHLAAAMSLHGS
jgi:hypothetical protein